MSVSTSIRVRAALRGRIVPYGPNQEPSAYFKRPVEGAVTVTSEGIAGDQQAGPTHGGPDGAIHHYPHDHYAAFAAERPEHSERLGSGYVFAENISTEGWTEWDVCLGDRFRLGTTVLELSQGRSPCWKLGHRFGDPTMVEAVVKSRRSGWYYRVLEPGSFAAGDDLIRIARPYPEWPVARAFGFLVAGERDPAALAEIAALPILGQAWHRRVERALAAAQG